MKFIYNKFKFIKIIIYIYILIKIMEKQNILNFLEMENKEEILEKIDNFFGNPNFSKVEDYKHHFFNQMKDIKYYDLGDNFQLQ